MLIQVLIRGLAILEYFAFKKEKTCGELVEL